MRINIRNIRDEIQLSQSQFSEIVGIPQCRLSELELQKETPTTDEFDRIKKAANDVVSGVIKPRTKKRISKQVFSTSIVNTNPRRSYQKTTRNDEYIALLEWLESKVSENNESGPVAVSFFAGCGGLCYGLKAAGFNIVAANELVDKYKAVYELNFPNIDFLSNDIRDISDSEIKKLLLKYPDIDLLAGGPPCQGFSLAGKRDVFDERNTLFQYYLHLADIIRPKIILMENVRLLTTMKAPDGNLVKDMIIDTFNTIGYNGDFYIVNAADFGVPQNRERVFFVGVRKDIGAAPESLCPICNHDNDILSSCRSKFSFGDAVSDLEFLEAGEHSAHDPYHKATNHPEHVVRWLYDVPQGKSAHDNETPQMRPPSGYNTTYKRQVWTLPGCTVTTNFTMISGSNNVHPIATRALTVREALRLQSFPDSFKLVGNAETVRTVIGNAVPPLMAYQVGLQLAQRYNLASK